MIVLVSGAAHEAEKIWLIAVRSGVSETNVHRAFANGRPWVLGAGTPAPAGRLQALGEREGWPTRSVATSAPTPSYLPAMVLGGVAQAPVWISSGILVVDTAIAAGLGITALASVVRQSRRIGPARAAIEAIAAWDELHRAPRETRGLEQLYALDALVAQPGLPAAVRNDSLDVVAAMWEGVIREAAQERDPARWASKRAQQAQQLRDALRNNPEQALTAIRAISS